MKDTDLLKNEDLQDELVSTFFQDPQMASDHLLKDDVFEKIDSYNLVINKNGNDKSDQDGGFGYVVIEYFLESFKEENVQANLTDMLHLETEGSLDHSP